MKTAKIVIRIILSIIVSIICLYFATRNVHWTELRSLIAKANLTLLLVSVAVSLLAFWVRAFRWKILLQPFQDIPTGSLLRWQIGGLLINNFFPLRMGEFARSYWASHKTSIHNSTIFATIVIERLLDICSIFSIGAVLMLVMGLRKASIIPSPAYAVWGLFALIVLGVAVMTLPSRITTKSVREKLKDWLPQRFYLMVEKFISGLRILKNRNEVLKLVGVSLVIWSIDITVLFIISWAMTLKLTWLQAGLTIVGLLLGVMIPAAPGAAGTYEAGGVGALTLMGFKKTISLSFVLLVHGLQYLVVLILGIPILMLEGFSFKSVYHDMEDETSKTSKEESGPVVP